MEDSANLKSIRVQYNMTKLKIAIANSSVNFTELKTQLIDRLVTMNLVPAGSLIEKLVNETDQPLEDAYIIGNCLKQNDLVKIMVVTQPSDEQVKSQIDTVTVSQALGDSPSVESDDIQLNTFIPDRSPKEAIVVLFDVSGSMSCNFFADKFMSRMGAVNALFSAFADKTLAYELNHIVQLFTFNSSVNKKCEFTDDMNYFINLVDGERPGGSTKLYEALVEGVQSLVEIKKKHPNIILRMIALTDGEADGSSITSLQIAKLFIKNRITLDSFVVSHNSLGLKTITHASGGRCYCPEDLMQGMSLFEIETILSVKARDLPSVTDEEIQKQLDILDMDIYTKRPFDTEGIKVNTEKMLNKETASVEDILKRFRDIGNFQPQSNGVQAVASATSTGGQVQPPAQNIQQMRRVVKEIEALVALPDDSCLRVFPESDNILRWKVLMIGPKNTPYNQGVFTLYVEIPENYPMRAPHIRFVTPIYHCNISSQGRACMDVLQGNWSPLMTVEKAIVALYILMETPNTNDALESSISAQMLDNIEVFNQKCIDHVKAFASPSIEELLKNILGDAIDQGSEKYLKTKTEIENWISKNRVSI